VPPLPCGGARGYHWSATGRPLLHPPVAVLTAGHSAGLRTVSGTESPDQVVVRTEHTQGTVPTGWQTRASTGVRQVPKGVQCWRVMSLLAALLAVKTVSKNRVADDDRQPDGVPLTVGRVAFNFQFQRHINVTVTSMPPYNSSSNGGYYGTQRPEHPHGDGSGPDQCPLPDTQGPAHPLRTSRHDTRFPEYCRLFRIAPTTGRPGRVHRHCDWEPGPVRWNGSREHDGFALIVMSYRPRTVIERTSPCRVETMDARVIEPKEENAVMPGLSCGTAGLDLTVRGLASAATYDSLKF